ncbi:hypothetical protein PsYK624_081570 [Phanerochaete sordida]|uniref:Uncharacterized protein n=1 Tax=Phanerochaete sordida TaxID=48140 RepID=A0A9P3LEW0_9APHY|nr:hypothetical protein PsYK624_081570 [Phanerochaete sordida]
MSITVSSRSLYPSRPAPRKQNSLGICCIDALDRSFAENNHIPSDNLLGIQHSVLSNTIHEELAAGPPHSDKGDSPFPELGYIPKPYFEYAQRTLSTLILAGTFMAGVEAQLLSLIFTAPDGPLRNVALGFSVGALLATAFVALYCAVTYIWLRQEWRHKTHCFNEWVAGSLRMMLIWCSVSLVMGVYSGFFAVVFFLFAAAPLEIAVFSAVVFALCGVGPMSWGFYYWYGLYRGWLEWVPHEDGSLPHRRQVPSA